MVCFHGTGAQHNQTEETKEALREEKVKIKRIGGEEGGGGGQEVSSGQDPRR